MASFFHVRGHQDKDPKCNLTITEIYNIKMWQESKMIRELVKPAGTAYDNPKIPEAQPHLQINGKTICQQFIPTIWHMATTLLYYTFDKIWTKTTMQTTCLHW